jgi:hypothetical protein
MEMPQNRNLPAKSGENYTTADGMGQYGSASSPLRPVYGCTHSSRTPYRLYTLSSDRIVGKRLAILLKSHGAHEKPGLLTRPGIAVRSAWPAICRPDYSLHRFVHRGSALLIIISKGHQ